MRRAFAAALALLLTGTPVVAAACALACPAPMATTHAVADADMPADCAAMHHGGADAQPVDTPDSASAARSSAPLPACCAIAAASVDLPPVVVDHVAPVATAVVPVATTQAPVATVDVLARGLAPPPVLPRDRARCTDILRL